MKRFIGCTTAILLIFFLVSGVSAHPPSELELTYNQTSGNLTAAFTHLVTDPTTHYLKNVKITLDGKEMINQDYSSQPSPDFFNYTYSLNAIPGTVIDVSGQCSIGGSIQRSLTV